LIDARGARKLRGRRIDRSDECGPARIDVKMGRKVETLLSAAGPKKFHPPSRTAHALKRGETSSEGKEPFENKEVGVATMLVRHGEL